MEQLWSIEPTLDNIQTWTYTKHGKVPVHPAGTPALNLLTLSQAQTYINQDHNIGILLSPEHPYCVIDVDHSLDIPEFIKPILNESTTYVEKSLSGNGLHILFQLDDEANLWAKHDKKITYVKAKAHNNWNGQISFTRNFMVITGNRISQPNTPIKQLSLSELKQLLKDSIGKPQALTSQQPDTSISNSTLSQANSISSFNKLAAMIKALPLDKREPVVNAYMAVTQNAYSHYDYWLTVGMALHHESTRLDKKDSGLLLWLEWSKTDPTSFVSDEDCINKWKSFNDSLDEDYNKSKITVNTLNALYAQLTFKWPKMAKKGPDTTAIANITYALSKLDITFYRIGSLGFFFKAPLYLKNTYFPTVQQFLTYYGPLSEPQLRIALTSLFQEECHWPGNTWIQQLFQYVLSSATTLNVLNMWLSAKPEHFTKEQVLEDNLKKPNAQDLSTFGHLMDAIELDEGIPPALAKLMIYKFLMQFIKMADPDRCMEPNEGFLVLAGPENTRKTSFFKHLLPPMLSFATTSWLEDFSSDKHKRDFFRLLVSKPLVYLDECDTIFTNNQVATEFKKILTSTTIEFTDIYSTEPRQAPRTAAMGGTTNVNDLVMSTTGSRRIWFVPIKFIHMEKLEHISRYWLFQNLKVEYDALVKDGQKPWLMTYEESKAVEASNSNFCTVSSTRLELADLFEIPERTIGYQMPIEDMIKKCRSPQQLNHPYLYRLKTLRDILAANGIKHSTASIKRAAEDLSIYYTGRRNTVQLTETVVYAHGTVIYKPNGLKTYLLPPLRPTEFTSKADEQKSLDDFSDNPLKDTDLQQNIDTLQ